MPWDWRELTFKTPLSVIDSYSELPWNNEFDNYREFEPYIEEQRTLKEELDYIYTQSAPNARNWLLGKLAKNPNTKWSDIMENKQVPWDWNSVSLNPNLTWEIVRDNPQIPWNWGNISENAFDFRR